MESVIQNFVDDSLFQLKGTYSVSYFLSSGNIPFGALFGVPNSFCMLLLRNRYKVDINLHNI